MAEIAGELIMGFKVFDAYGAATRPEATLRASGYLFLSKGIQNRAGCDDAAKVQLLFDESMDRLAIKFYGDSDDLTNVPGVREISKEKSGIAVNLLPLLRFYGFPEPKDVGKETFAVTFEDSLAVIDLREYKQKATAAEEQNL